MKRTTALRYLYLIGGLGTLLLTVGAPHYQAG